MPTHLVESSVTDDFLQVSEREVGELRQQMLAFTRLQLANDFAAEDIVQEALAGALKNAASFIGVLKIGGILIFGLVGVWVADSISVDFSNPGEAGTVGNFLGATALGILAFKGFTIPLPTAAPK